MSAFEEHRSRLLTVGYRLLGSRTEAEDVIQEAHLRWLDRGQREAEHPRAWLERTVINLCLDERRSARVRRETYVGCWLPEPLENEDPALGPEREVEHVSLAFLTLLERLSPLERAVYVLTEAFDYSPDELAAVLDRTPAAVRQLLHRAREHVSAERPRFSVDKATHQQMLERFFAAVVTGNVADVEALLAKDAVVRSDGGGKVRAAINVVQGSDRAARFMLGVAQKGDPRAQYEFREINRMPSLVGVLEGRVISVSQLETDGERVTAINVVVNPDKLLALR